MQPHSLVKKHRVKVFLVWQRLKSDMKEHAVSKEKKNEVEKQVGY